eukprot:689898-Amphidinium_carterae.1
MSMAVEVLQQRNHPSSCRMNTACASTQKAHQRLDLRTLLVVPPFPQVPHGICGFLLLLLDQCWYEE